MMSTVRIHVALLFPWLALTLWGADLSEVRSVYLLPMSSGLDQYLANRLTNLRAFQVVTDPHKADAVLTDRIGAAFEQRLEELYPKPAPKPAEERAPAKSADKSSADKARGDKAPAEPDKTQQTVRGDLTVVSQPVGGMAGVGRSRGTVFLVDLKSREILWSSFQPPKDLRSKELDQVAQRIVNQLKQDLSQK